MIHFYHVTKRFDRYSTALQEVTFHIEKGEFVFLTGPSGAGKSTLLRLILRQMRPTEGQIIVNGATGRIPAFVDTGLNLVHVDDVAAGHVLALERGKTGEHYILGGQDVTLKAMLESVARCANRRPPRIQLPRAPIYPVAIAAEITGRLTGKTPFITVDGLRMSKHRMFFSSAKAERELGYRARPYEDGIRDAIAWFRDAGYLV